MVEQPPGNYSKSEPGLSLPPVDYRPVFAGDFSPMINRTPEVVAGDAGVSVGSLTSYRPDASWNGTIGMEDLKYGFPERVIIATVLCIIIFFSVSGNVLVCLAVVTDRNLRKTNNYFIVSLAIADMLVALFVMSLATANDIMGYWPFGEALCNIWMSFDVMCCTSSILNLCAISLDRYIHIKNPLHYERWMTRGRTILCLAFIWLLSILISFLPIHLGWHRLDKSPNEDNPGISQHYVTDPYSGQTTTPTVVLSNGTVALSGAASDQICMLELNPMFAVTSSMVSFYIPCLVMILIYIKMFQYARMHVKAIKKHLAVGIAANADADPEASGSARPSQYKLSDHKAAITLGVIMGVFLFCWVPFFTINIISSFCVTCIPPIVFSIFTWLGYLNSTMNPVIYSIFNQEFRVAFKRILSFTSCRKGSLGERRNHPDFGYDKPIARTNGALSAVEYGTTGSSSRRTSTTRLMPERTTCV